MSATAFVFLDANVFLHTKPLETLDWRSFFGASEVILLVAAVTTGEVDKHKESGRTRGIRKRAGRALKTFDQALSSEGDFRIADGVFLRFYTREHRDYEMYTLSQDRPDDRLVLAAIHAGSEESAPVSILTNDYGVRTKCKERRVAANPIPEEWLEPSAPDEVEQELAQLKATLPNLSATTLDGSSPMTVRKSGPPPSDDFIVQQCVTRVRNRLLPQVEESTRHYGFNIAPAQFLIGYNQHQDWIRDTYLPAFAEFCKEWLDHEQCFARVVPFELRIANSGGSPATNLRVVVKVAGPESLQSAYEASPKPPTLLSYSEFANPVSPAMQLSMLRNRPATSNVSANKPSWAVRNLCAELYVDRLQQGSDLLLPPLFAEFDNYRTMEGLHVECQLFCDERPQPSSAAIDIVVVRTQSDSLDRMPGLTL